MVKTTGKTCLSFQSMLRVSRHQNQRLFTLTYLSPAIWITDVHLPQVLLTIGFRPCFSYVTVHYFAAYSVKDVPVWTVWTFRAFRVATFYHARLFGSDFSTFPAFSRMCRISYVATPLLKDVRKEYVGAHENWVEEESRLPTTS